MHISEGVLSVPVLISGAAVAAGGTIIGLKRIKDREVPKLALLSATFFTASLIHIPFGVTSVHLILNGLLGILLGWAAFPAILVALFMQAVFFQYGGLTTLGVNTMVMGVPALTVWLIFKNLSYITQRVKRKSAEDAALALISFICGFTAILFSVILLGLSLYCSGDEFIPVVQFAIIAHIPVMIIEGVITASIILFLKKVKPETLEYKL